MLNKTHPCYTNRITDAIVISSFTQKIKQSKLLIILKLYIKASTIVAKFISYLYYKMEKAAPPSYYSTEVASQPAVISTIYPPVPTIPFGPTPQVVTCPSCHNHATTTIKVEPSSKTHKLAVILCLVCCCLCCLPYCIDSCQNRNHYCQSCGAYLGTYAS